MDEKRESYQISVVVRSAPQYVGELPFSPVAGLEVPADPIPDQKVELALAFLTLLDRQEFDQLRERERVMVMVLMDDKYVPFMCKRGLGS